MPTRIYIHQAAIRRNERDGTNGPVVFVDFNNGVIAEGHGAVIHGPSRVVYSSVPLAGGARCWIETEAEVEVE